MDKLLCEIVFLACHEPQAIFWVFPRRVKSCFPKQTSKRAAAAHHQAGSSLVACRSVYRVARTMLPVTKEFSWLVMDNGGLFCTALERRTVGDFFPCAGDEAGVFRTLSINDRNATAAVMETPATRLGSMTQETFFAFRERVSCRRERCTFAKPRDRRITAIWPATLDIFANFTNMEKTPEKPPLLPCKFARIFRSLHCASGNQCIPCLCNIFMIHYWI